MMDDNNYQLFEMMRDRFDGVDNKLDAAKDSFDKHAASDEKYWRIIDGQQAQISMIKWAGGALSGSSLVAWLVSKWH